MSETIEKVLGYAAVITGVVMGMPWLTLGGSMLLGDAAQKAAKRQARDQYNASQVDRLVNTNSTTATRALLLGRVRVGGNVFFRASTGTNNAKFVMCVALAGHEIDAVETVYLNDVPVTLDANGYVMTAPYANGQVVSASATIPAGSTSVTLPQAPNADSVHARISQTVSQENGDVVVDTLVTSTVSGSVVTITAQASTVTVSYQYTTFGSNGSTARVRAYTGSPGQTADAQLIALFPTLWTTAHRAQGVAYLICEFDYNETSFPSGIPTVTALVRGAKLYDPRSATTAWSENPALMMRHILTHPNFGKRTSLSAAEDTRIMAAANACDTSHTYTSGGVSTTVPLFRAGLVVPFGAVPRSALDDLAAAMGGMWAHAQGQFFVRAGVWTSSVKDLTDIDLVGSTTSADGSTSSVSISVATHKARADKFNVAQVTIYDAAQSYKQVPLPPLKGTTLIARDGAELVQALDLQAVNFAPQALHCAGVLMRDARDPMLVQLTCKLSAYAIEMFDIVSVTLPRFGWVSKTFMVLGRKWSLDGLIQLTLKETVATIYQPDASFVAGGYADNTSLNTPWALQPPGALTLTSAPYTQTDGTVVSRILVTWPAITDLAVLQAGQVELQWQRIGDTQWTSVIVAGSETQAYILGVQDATAIVIRARTRNSIAISPWGTQAATVSQGQAAAPPAVTTLTATGGMFQIALSWVIAAAVRTDLAYTEIWASTTDDRATAGRITVVPLPDRSYNHIGLQPGQTWFYWARVIDTSGNAGPWYPALANYGIPAAPSSDPSALLEQLQNALGMDQLANDLVQPIGTTNAGAIVALQNTLAEFDLTSRMQWQEQITNATITQDPLTGKIQLLATAAVTTDVESRLSSVEVLANADHSTLSGTVSTLTTQGNTLTTQQSQITALQSSVSVGASTVYVDNAIATATGALNVEAAQAYTDLAAAEIQAALDTFTGQQTQTALSGSVALAQSTLDTNAGALVAQAKSIDALVAAMAGNGAAIVAEQSARATGDSANANSLTTLTARLDSGDYAAVKTQSSATANAVGVIEAKHAVNVDVNGHVAGYELMSTGTVSAFGILADRFLIYKPDGTGTPVQMLTLGTVNGVTALGLDGNLIIDGSIVARSINTNGLDIRDALGNVIFSAGHNLDWTRIANVSIGSAQIGNAAVQTANIGDLQVSTLKIAGNAVTLPAANYTAGVYGGADLTLDIQTVTITSTGADALITATCYWAGDANSTGVTINVLRDSTVIYIGDSKSSGNMGGCISALIKDTPPAGSHTYRLRIGALSGGIISANSRALAYLELKR